MHRPSVRHPVDTDTETSRRVTRPCVIYGAQTRTKLNHSLFLFTVGAFYLVTNCLLYFFKMCVIT